MFVAYPSKHMLNQLLRIALAPRTRLATKVHEVVRIVVTITHHVVLGVMQEWQELVVKASLAFPRKLVPQSPHATAEDSPEIIHVLPRRHPVFFISSHCLY